MYELSTATVITMVHAEGFGATEDYIETLPLTDEQKSALWLLAWAEAPSHARQRITLANLKLLPGAS